jgi:hypothetical protein
MNTGNLILQTDENRVYYMGHIMTDRKYLNISPEFREQGI